MASLSIRNVYKTYANGIPILKGINLDVEDGQFLILVGASGCGKSTLLNLIAGLEAITSGEILIGQKTVNDLPPKDRDIAMVFQSYALYPSMTVRENISFGLKIRKTPKAEQQRIIEQVSQTLQIDHLLDRKPAQLSGGQRQRVAMGRALARDPALFLFDEPLSNLDAKLRIEVRAEIKSMHQRLRNTIVYVTHDQIEAMTLGDRIAVMKDGVVQQFGTPQEIYDNPANLFVAGFIGSPPMNFIHGTLSESGAGVGMMLDTGATQVMLNLPFGRHSAEQALPQAVRQRLGQPVILGLRAEHITDCGAAQRYGSGDIPYIQEIPVQADAVEPTGPDTLVYTQVNGQKIACRMHPAAAPRPEEKTTAVFDVSKAVLFDPQTEARLV
jgi:multiple sugar transport system ATP-binding protein